jgi:hypothetical protein
VIAFITKIFLDIGRNPGKVEAAGPRLGISPWIVYSYFVF